MLSYRHKTVAWFAIALSFITILILVALLVFVSVDTYHKEKSEVKALAGNIAMVLDTLDFNGKSRDPGKVFAPMALCLSRDMREELAAGTEIVGKHLGQQINDKILFLFDDEDFNVGYAVYDRNDRLIYKYHHGVFDPFTAVFHRDLGFHVRRISHQDWVFYQCYRGKDYWLVVSDIHRFDVVADIVWGAILAIPIIAAVSWLMGIYLSNKVLIPFTNIARTVSKIEQGQLHERIPDTHSRDEIQELVNKLNHTFGRLESSFNHINQFSSDVAHELRTPLTAMRCNLEVCLRNPRDTTDYQQAISEAIADLDYFTKIIDALLLMGRPEKDFERQRLEEANFSLIVKGVVEQLSSVATDRDIRLHDRIADDITVNGIDIFLSQLCYNLIHNAIKFSASNSDVTVSLERNNGAVVFSVEDHGVGIDQASQERIFDRFYQVDPSRRVGTGLGLALVRWIVNLHQGTISVDSAVGRGSRFCVELSRT